MILQQAAVTDPPVEQSPLTGRKNTMHDYIAFMAKEQALISSTCSLLLQKIRTPACAEVLISEVKFATKTLAKQTSLQSNFTAKGNFTCPKGKLSFQNKKHFLRSAFCFGGTAQI
jgi:hypothetical protein